MHILTLIGIFVAGFALVADRFIKKIPALLVKILFLAAVALLIAGLYLSRAA